MRAARILIGLLMLLAVVAGAAYLLRLPLAGIAVRAAIGAAGLENPRARVTALSLDRIALADVAAGPAGREIMRIDAAEATYDWRALVFERRVETVRAGPGAVRLSLSPQGAVTLPGLEGGGGEGGGALPFSALTIAEITLALDTPEGAASGAVSGDYDVENGGAARLQVQTQRAGIGTLTFENAALDVAAEFAGDGAATLSGVLTGDVRSSYGALSGVDVAIKGAGRSWKDVAAGKRSGFAGEARIDLKSATAPVAKIPFLAGLGAGRAALIFGAPVSTLDMTGSLALALDETGFSASLGDAPVRLRADSGAELSIEALEGDPVFRRTQGAGEANFTFTVSGALVSVVGTVNAETIRDGWFVLAPLRVGEYRGQAVSIDNSSAIIRAETRPGGLRADVTTSTLLRDVSIGRFNILDAPILANVVIDADQSAQSATVSLPEDRCITLERGRFTLIQQDMAAALKHATLCQNEQPLAVIDWNGDLTTQFAGVLTASEASYRLGQTRFSGRPPKLDVAGTYRPAVDRTHVAGTISGGAVDMNGLLSFSAADGAFNAALDAQNFKADARFDALRISQTGKAPLVAPVIVSGKARLEGRDARFDYALMSPTGRRIGAGEGVHDVASARGRTTFVFDRIEFKPDGAQPEQLAPVLRGWIGKATGATTGSGEFAWAPSGVTSRAEVAVENVAFNGPTRVVTRTSGLNGTIRFSSLWPIATDGVQTISVGGVDLFNLVLDSGEIEFELPGDETLRVDKASFPWFGGVLGIYKANLSMTGGKATAPLRAEGVDLKQILDFVNVNGLSGEGILSGVLPLVVEDGRARIENGVLKSDGPGAIRYVGAASEVAAGNEQARIAFDLLRDLRYNSLGVTINGPLDGRLDFQIKFEGSGEMSLNQQNVRVPVIYRIGLDAALLELLNQVNLSRSIDLQLERALQDRAEE